MTFTAPTSDAALQQRVDELELLHTSALELIDNLQIALTTCRRIGIAVGIVMAQHRVTEDAAFEMLRVAGQSRGRKVRDVAEDVVRTGTLD